MEIVFAGRYRLGRRLGSGAMGAVYEALDLATHRRRALKIMHAHMIDREDLRERFALEARITGKIQSPFIVDVVDAGVAEDGVPYLAMELLRGEDMSRYLRRVGRLSPGEALSLLAQVAAALDETHRAGIVHRDLKPANLFIEDRSPEAPRIKVLDFGIATVATGTFGHATGAAGTPIYMAPEQFRSGRVGAATDVFALGMISFTLLTGRAYWDDERYDHPDMVAFALVAVEGPREPASARASRLGASLPGGFDPWFARATARDPRERFATAGAAVRALAEALGMEVKLPEPAAPVEASRAEDDAAVGAPTLTADLSPSRVADGASRERGSLGGTTETAPLPAADSGPPEDRRSSGEPPLDRTSAVPDERIDRRSADGASPAVKRDSPENGGFGLRVAPIGLGAAALLALGLWLGPQGAPGPARPSPAPSPLHQASSVLACPVFGVAGVEEPSGWLGAAAASTFCERARLVLGGAAGRTLSPAELLNMPVEPSEQLPEDPYSPAGVRARSIESARSRGAVIADGLVTREPSGYRVEIALRRADGTEIGREAGSGRALYEAVRAAMAPLVRSGALSAARELDPAVAEHARAPDVDTALLLHDLSFAMAQNAGSVHEECRRVAARAGDLPEIAPGARFRCAYTLGQLTPDVDFPEAPKGSAGALAARARGRLMAHKDSDPAVAAELLRMLAVEKTPLGQSTLAATASCLVQARDPERARALALRAIQADPRNTIGDWCAPWIQAAAVTHGTASARGVLRAMRAWAPWDPYGWAHGASGAEGLAHARRAYLLSPFDTYLAETLAGRLIAAGAREEARAVAIAVAAGGEPVHHLESELLVLRVDASQGRFRSALERAVVAMAPAAGDAGWVRVQRLEAAWRALQIALVLGRAAEVADRVVEKLIVPEPSPLDGASIEVPLRIPAVCARASRPVARRCFERFQSLRERLSLGALPDTDTFVRGAERYAGGDLSGAAAAWRSLVRDPGPYVALLGEAMIEAFEHTGELDLVERLEAAEPDDGDELAGASFKTVRAARRAAKRGDREAAAALAAKVVGAWSVADEVVPVVAEMRSLSRR